MFQDCPTFKYVTKYSQFNPLTNDHKCTHHATLTACYQLAQSILKIGSALAERVGQGEVGGCHPDCSFVHKLFRTAIVCGKFDD